MGIGGEVLEPSGPGRICVRTEDGRVLDMGVAIPADAEPVDVRLLCEIETYRFPTCPICGDQATTAEHVPPESVGGVVRTWTCPSCNHGPATLVEADLHAWFDQRLVQVGFRHESVAGLRRAAPIRLRATRDGEFALIVVGGDRALPGMLDAGGHFSMEFAEPDPARYEVALLKHAYLAACLHLREVPTGPAADAVRAELVTISESPDRFKLPPSPIAGGLRYARSYEQVGSELSLAWATWSDGTGQLALVLSGLLVSWPIDDDAVVTKALTLAKERRGLRAVAAVADSESGACGAGREHTHQD